MEMAQRLGLNRNLSKPGGVTYEDGRNPNPGQQARQAEEEHERNRLQ